MRKCALLIVTCLLLLASLSAQKGYDIKFKIDGLKDTTAYLAYYFGSGQYYKDTTEVNDKGEAFFKGDDTLTHGMYSFIQNGAKLFDFFVTEQQFQMNSDTVELIANMNVKGSFENEIFFEYMKFLNKKQRAANQLQQEMKSADGKAKEETKEKLNSLDNEVLDFITNFHKKYKGSLASNFIYALEYPKVPDAPINEDGSSDSTFAFKYFKTHFFDNFDFTDQRLLHTSTYDKKIMYYLDKLTAPEPDSIIKEVDYILGNAAKNDQLFKYTLTKLTSKYERSENMGMDAVFVHLGKEYFLKGLADEWFTEAQLEKLKERVIALDPLLIGKKAPNIIVKDTAQKKFLQLYNIDANYTVVYIWSPDCGHCKKSTPKLKTLYDKVKDRGVEVFGVGNEFENEAWKKFIIKHDLNFINGSDGGDFRSNFRNLYDVYSTPQTYLLDKDKKILAKKMSIESLENIIEFYLKKDEKEAKDNEK